MLANPATALPAADIGQVLQALRPLVRQVVDAADPGMLSAFDTSYDDDAADAADRIVDGPDDPDVFSRDQALGLRNPVGSHVAAFMINVAASIAVAHVQAAHPDWWQWITMCPAPHASQAASGDPVVRLFAYLDIPEDGRGRAIEQFRSSPALVQALDAAPPP